MIERTFITQKTKEFYIKRYIEDRLKGVGISQIKLKKIPLGEKIIIHTSRPSLVVGSKGSNIRELTQVLKKRFKLENPQVEINEVKNIYLDANIIAQRIANSLERFGPARFKGVGHRVMENVMAAGALGIELIISGKIPGARAKSWRFYQGYLKKCGDVAVSGVRKAQKTALLKSGVIGIKVAIMPPDVVLPDNIEILEEPVQVVEEVKSSKKKTGGTEKSKVTKEEAKSSAPEEVADESEKSMVESGESGEESEGEAKSKSHAEESQENIDESSDKSSDTEQAEKTEEKKSSSKKKTTKKAANKKQKEEKQKEESVVGKIAHTAEEIAHDVKEAAEKVIEKVEDALHIKGHPVKEK